MKTLTVNGVTYTVASAVPVSSAVLRSDAWVDNNGVFSQEVEVAGVTRYAKVDLQPTPEQDKIFHEKTLSFVAENDSGKVTVYSIGAKPRDTYTIQVTLTEVSDAGAKIRGNTVGVPNPQPDWNQTDSTKANYIRNKPSSTGGGGTGENGATFIPYINDTGTISWSNDKGMANPDPVNLVDKVIEALPVYGGEVRDA